MRSAGRSLQTSSRPFGQRTSRRSTRVAAPRPKCTRGSDAPPYPTAVLTWLHCAPAAVTTLSLAPVPSRGDAVPTALTDSQWLGAGDTLRHSSSGPSSAVTTLHGAAPLPIQPALLAGPAVATEPSAATTAPAPDTADRIVQSLKFQVARGGGDAVLHIQPEHLGPVAISLRVEDGAVSAVITAEHPAVAEWLQSNQQSLRDGLEASGLHLERFVVQRDGQSPSDRQRREWLDARRRDHRRRSPQPDSTFEISI